MNGRIITDKMIQDAKDALGRAEDHPPGYFFSGADLPVTFSTLPKMIHARITITAKEIHARDKRWASGKKKRRPKSFGKIIKQDMDKNYRSFRRSFSVGKQRLKFNIKPKKER